ncbi:hypothetical protein H9651_10315 [Microbacterium sp. Sa4CUA7]|uniref:Uncharacterized protein n=2 Tax=Microbacterium pullorum TaxID=2762236 RepID=A0ABR8S3I6_9MICO|nr:hypothetical protein [Microbacterium pullorum]
MADAPASHAAGESDAVPPQYGVGPFSVREVALIGVWAVAFVVSFFSLYNDGRIGAALGLGASVWSSGLEWILTIGVPTVAVFLVVLRRFSPDGIRRVGSLGIDQFASVAFSVSAVVWLSALWTNVARGVQTGIWVSSWVVWVEFFLMLVGVVLTVFAAVIPPLSEDFQHRREVVAHRNARPLRPVTARPTASRPAAADHTATATPAADPASGAAYGAPAHGAPVYGAATGQPAYGEPAYGEPAYGEPAYGEPAYDAAAFGENPDMERSLDDQPFAETGVIEQTPAEQTDAATTASPVGGQAFWALVPVERDVVDEYGVPLFRVGPDAWALVIEDRVDVFVVRHEDGRVGYLNDVSGVTRG